MSACHPHAEEMIELGRKLWGEPNRQRSTRSDIRFGSYGSKSIRLDKGEWYDHEAIEGGGYANLYFKVHGRYPEHNGQRSNIFQTYDYQDGNGRLLFQVVRKIPKDFRQRRPDGNGGWIWNLQGVERIPYRLPELLAAPLDTTIYIAEGEKDVDNLRKHGLVATCNPGGAQEHKPGQPYRGKWKRSYSEFLRNRSVVILPDNDKTGEAHAQDVARKLNGIARTVRILNLPNLPSKGDVSDWFAAGGTAEELERLAGEMPEAEPQAAAAERDGPFAGATSVDELIAEFNEKYSVVNEAGKTIIYSRTHDPILNRRFYHRLGFADLRKLYMNRLIRVGTDKYSNPVMRTAADVWLRHRARRQYTDGIVFDPSGHPTPPGVLNLWSGFAYTPAPGDWSLLRAHICDVICSGCEEHFRYLMGWLARMVQHPGELGEVAVVMRGGEGCGKGTLGRVLSAYSASTASTFPKPSTWSAISTPTSATPYSCLPMKHFSPAISSTKAY